MEYSSEMLMFVQELLKWLNHFKSWKKTSILTLTSLPGDQLFLLITFLPCFLQQVVHQAVI